MDRQVYACSDRKQSMKEERGKNLTPLMTTTQFASLKPLLATACTSLGPNKNNIILQMPDVTLGRFSKKLERKRRKCLV